MTSDSDLISRKDALEAIQSLRHAAACNFSPRYSGNEGQGRCESFYEAYEAVRKMEPAALATTAGAGAGDWVTVPRNPQDGNRPLPFDRDVLGRMVREAWVRWAKMQPSPKPSWLVPYEGLSETDKEAERLIGETVARWTLIGDAAANSLVDAAPAVPASPRSGAGEGEEGAAVMNQLTAEAISADVRRIHEAVLLMKAFENGYAAAEERLSACSPAPAELGAEIRELRAVAEGLVAFWDRIGNGQHEKLDDLVRQAKAALSQGGGAGRSDRAVEIRELSEKATQGPWVYRPDRYDDWGFIRAPRDTADMPGEVVAISRGEGHDTFAAHRKAGTDPYEANGRFIVTLANAWRSGELVHRSEIAEVSAPAQSPSTSDAEG